MPFGDHLEDLRRRLMFALIGIVPLFVAALFVGPWFVQMLFEPVLSALEKSGNPPNMRAGLFEFFTSYVKVALVLTITVGLPWVLFQAWKFVAPGLYAHERRFAYLLVPMSVILSLVGVVFMYRVMLPVVVAFFIALNAGVHGRASPIVEQFDAAPAMTIPTYEGDPANPVAGQMWVNRVLNQWRIALPDKEGVITIWSSSLIRGDQLLRQEFGVKEYIDIVFDFALAFAIAFQAPVAVLLLGWAGIIEPALMKKYRRHAIMVCTVVGAILTPADPISIFLLAIPLYLLYELGLAMLRWLPADRVARGLGMRNTHEPHEPEASGP